MTIKKGSLVKHETLGIGKVLGKGEAKGALKVEFKEEGALEVKKNALKLVDIQIESTKIEAKPIKFETIKPKEKDSNGFWGCSFKMWDSVFPIILTGVKMKKPAKDEWIKGIFTLVFNDAIVIDGFRILKSKSGGYQFREPQSKGNDNKYYSNFWYFKPATTDKDELAEFEAKKSQAIKAMRGISVGIYKLETGINLLEK